MRALHRLSGVALAAGLALAFAPASAGAVAVTCGSGSGIGGQTVDVAITTADLTGLAVHSFQFDLSYAGSLVTPVSLVTTGTLIASAGWSSSQLGVGANKATISAAGTTSLAGAGTLIVVRFLINPAQLGASGTSLALANFVFNEGSPATTTTNGGITINATPIITVSPDAGEIVRGQTLSFGVSGSVSPPVTWGVTDGTVASIGASGVLTGLAPGAVRVFAVDNAGHRDTTNSDILVRGMSLTAGTVSLLAGQTVAVPLSVSTLDGLGIRSGQFTLTFNPAVAVPIAVETPATTLLHNWGPTGLGVNGSQCTVDFVGSTDLSGSGTLCFVRFSAVSKTTTATSLALSNALFNETLPARTANGTLTVNGLPVVTVSPDAVTLLAGQTQAFSLVGTVTPPVTWSVLDPGIADISPSGLLTALHGGVTRVQAVDAVGATDQNSSVTVYDFKASLPGVTGPPGSTVRVELSSDRDVGALDIRSLQYTILYDATRVTAVRAGSGGLVGAWGSGGIVSDPRAGRVDVAAAGTAGLASGSTTLQVLEFDLSPSAPLGFDIPLTLSGLMCNEGAPAALAANGVIHVSHSAGVEGGTARFALAPCAPNPAVGGTSVSFTLPADATDAEPADLALFDLGGRRVRTLAHGELAAGTHVVRWDGRDDDGGRAAPGLYWVRLDWQGRRLVRKLAIAGQP